MAPELFIVSVYRRIFHREKLSKNLIMSIKNIHMYITMDEVYLERVFEKKNEC